VAALQSSLKILQVASSLEDWGGIERYVVYLTQGLAERRHEVTVACPSGSPIADRLPGTVPIRMRRKLDLQGFVQYLRLFQSQRFDVVHGHFSPDFTLPAYAAKLTKQPLTVMTRHVCLPWPSAKAAAYLKLWNHIVPVSNAVETRLAESGVPKARMTVAKAGLSPPSSKKPREEARDELRLGKNDFAIGSFGRLTTEKGVGHLIDASAQLQNAKICVFGSGPIDTELKKQAEGKPVQFYGQITDVADAMLAMDVIAIPSVWEEAFPYAALEAMALARPVAASRIGGLPEMVEDGVNGRLFNSGDSQDIAVKLNELRQNPAQREQMGQLGRRRYESEFTIPHMVDRMEAVYRTEMLKGTLRRSGS